MANPALVGDIGGTNSRFALVDEGVAVRDIEKFKNDEFPIARGGGARISRPERPS